MACRIFNWMETFAKIRAKTGKTVVFRMNEIQQIMAQVVALHWMAGLAVKMALPKSRQLGSSTFWVLLFYAMCEAGPPGWCGQVIAHDEAGSASVFKKAHVVKKGLIKSEWGPSQLEQDQGAYLRWDDEAALGSGTIKTGDALGRGDVSSGILCSEAASFSDKGNDAKRAVTALLQTCYEWRWKIEVYEATAKGRDPFYYPLCMEALDPKSGTDCVLVFLPWFLDTGYTLSWEDFRAGRVERGKSDPGPTFIPTEEEQALRAVLAATEVRPEERFFRYRRVLTDEQLIWRRWAIDNKCQGDPDHFKREYPATFEEAFAYSADSMFDAETRAHYRLNACKAAMVGEISSTDTGGMSPTPIFERVRGGSLRVWEEPRKGADYVLSADIGGEKTASDPYSAYVLNKNTAECVASMYGHFEWDDFTDKAIALAYWYNTALLIPENNHNPAVAKRMHRANYPNLYYYQNVDRARQASAPSDPGFNTNRKTRPEILKHLKKACRDRSLGSWDKKFAAEMDTFVWVPKPNAENPDRDGEYRATGRNHDDCIMAMAIGVFFCTLPEPKAFLAAPPPAQTRAYKFLQEYMETWGKEGNEDGEDGEDGDFLNLGAPIL
jgi:hypothetical protein